MERVLDEGAQRARAVGSLGGSEDAAAAARSSRDAGCGVLKSDSARQPLGSRTASK